jgi:hypothetical protein
MASAKVALVFDRDFGEKPNELHASMAVWIIDSPQNKEVAQGLWNLHPEPEHMITTFKGPSVVDDTYFEGWMDNIELHHGEHSQTPPFLKLEVFGLKPTPMVEQVLTRFGFNLKETTITGFLAERSPET